MGTNLILFGSPGTGKGTQSKLLISKYKFHHISTGDLFRRAIRDKTALGQEARSYMEKGQLVPDTVVINLIKEVLNLSSEPGFIFDGFPRTQAQATALDSLLQELELTLDKVLYLQLPETILIERIEGRRVAEKSGCVYHIKFNPPRKEGVCDKSGEKLVHRPDDIAEVIKKRLQAYYEQTLPLIKYYNKQNILQEVDACGTPKEVFLRIERFLKFTFQK